MVFPFFNEYLTITYKNMQDGIEKGLESDKIGTLKKRIIYNKIHSWRCYERLPPPGGVRVSEKQGALALPNGI
jgi:hypothetical protein